MADHQQGGRYLREFYRINRATWPTMTRRAAFVDAFRLAWKVKTATQSRRSQGGQS